MGRIMPKALLVLIGFVVIGAGVLIQRQQSLEMRYRSAQLHRQIQAAQAKLWRQQIEIAEFTSPKTMLERTARGEQATSVDADGVEE